MSVRIVVGAQWGDEGKGKIVDLLGADSKYVVRYQGGANAGHTLVIGEKKIVLHLIPSGIFHPNTQCVIGNGVVVDPLALVDEIEDVANYDINLENRFYISESAHVILPYHQILDTSKEDQKGDDAIGTTGRGIGPAYMHKIGRIGIRMGDLLDMQTLEAKVKSNLDQVNKMLKYVYHKEEVDHSVLLNQLKDVGSALAPYITDTSNILHRALEHEESILLEGAQGSLLDIDHGTYPYVTSSNPTAGGACTGSGLSPLSITNVTGISKAYCTRVGNGPFPTELEGEEGEHLREEGMEFGATTGRPRRCGWLDLVALKYAVQINGISELVITKMDVLSDFNEIKACTSYHINEDKVTRYPVSTNLLQEAIPSYTSFPGWKQDLNDVKSRSDLPDNAQKYLSFIDDYVGIDIVILSIGPKRSETILFK